MGNEELKEKEVSEEAKGNAIMAEILDWIYCIGLAVVIVLLVKHFVFSTTIVEMDSMLPTVQEKNMLIVNRFAQVTGQPLERGDIVILEAPDGKVAGSNIAYYAEDSLIEKFGKLFRKILYIKRVVGLPGDHLVIDGDDVYINGELLKEEYINTERADYIPNYDQEIEIPEGYVFCMGDNRDVSKDSRSLGLIPINKVEGKTTFRIFPFDKFGNIE